MVLNLVRQLEMLNRIDDFGGYVYDDGDVTPTSNNPKNFRLIDYPNDFPKDIEKKQYFLLKPSTKLPQDRLEDLLPMFFWVVLRRRNKSCKSY